LSNRVCWKKCPFFLPPLSILTITYSIKKDKRNIHVYPPHSKMKKRDINSDFTGSPGHFPDISLLYIDIWIYSS